MPSLAIIALSVGVILGLRLKWLSLVPAVAVAFAATAGLAIMGGSGVEWAMLAMALLATALQMGYLCGAGITCVIAAARATRLRPIASSTH